MPHPAPISRSCAWNVERTHDFFGDLFRRAGLSAHAYRGVALSRRIPACLRFLRVKDLDSARLKLESRPDLVSATLSVVLLGVTEFFRDHSVFDQLQASMVPHLHRLGQPPRVWSAACSDGRELYTVAVLLNEAGLLTGSHLLGTDCREEAILTAWQGNFPVAVLDKVETSWRGHFVAHRDEIRPRDELRRVTRWKQADLLQGVEPGPWDLILWRNMAIYLDPASARNVWDGLIRQLSPGGYLVTGKADYPPRNRNLEKIGPCIFRKMDSLA
jgi:chemotaxis protein methyltransferase CheR